jgi:hypothetical protein
VGGEKAIAVKVLSLISSDIFVMMFSFRFLRCFSHLPTAKEEEEKRWFKSR